MDIKNVSTTPVYDSYWDFACERQRIYIARMAGRPWPWTDDPILANHRFTNCYRAADRVSQYLIREVIYGAGRDPDPRETVFRILLFKLFNRIETWEAVDDETNICLADFDPEKYTALLNEAKAMQGRIYSNAYMMSDVPRFGGASKHQNHLRLLDWFMQAGFPDRITAAASLEEVYQILREVPGFGDFLAFQYAIDINYSPVINFDENDFVIPGPGAKDGITKCFAAKVDYVAAIKHMVANQEREFEKRNLSFDYLGGQRRLHLIDCQNLFCEIDKYARAAHPAIKGLSGRTQIKQKYAPHSNPHPAPFFPPKWQLDKSANI